MSHDLEESFQSAILDATGASALRVDSVIQELWSGYGQILRVALSGCARQTVVVKHVCLPELQQHPRGWNSDLSHQRKVFSYQVETEWYRSWSSRCDQRCRIPGFLSYARSGENVLLVLEESRRRGISVAPHEPGVATDRIVPALAGGISCHLPRRNCQ